MKLYEIFIAPRTTDAGEEIAERSLFRRAEGPAVAEARKLKKEGLQVAVYECELDTTTPVDTYFKLLNREIEPVRGDLVFGRDIAYAAK